MTLSFETQRGEEACPHCSAPCVAPLSRVWSDPAPAVGVPLALLLASSPPSLQSGSGLGGGRVVSCDSLLVHLPVLLFLWLCHMAVSTS